MWWKLDTHYGRDIEPNVPDVCESRKFDPHQIQYNRGTMPNVNKVCVRKIQLTPNPPQ